ncbi:MAG: phosphatase PAP2 family protein [Nanoarchaeota archaeon]
MENNQSSFLVAASKIISAIFDQAIFVALLLFITLYLFYKKRKKEAICLIFLTAISFSLEQLIKIVTQRVRPLNAVVFEKTFSFPSGHALMAVIFIGTLVYLFEHHIKSNKRRNFLTIISVLLIILISSTRIYMNVHWFTDVLAGFALGIFLLMSYIIIIQHTDIFKTKQSL